MDKDLSALDLAGVQEHGESFSQILSLSSLAQQGEAWLSSAHGQSRSQELVMRMCWRDVRGRNDGCRGAVLMGRKAAAERL